MKHFIKVDVDDFNGHLHEHCFVVLQRVDCTNRQCNATQETTTSESCQKCEDLEKCYNFVVSSSRHKRLYFGKNGGPTSKWIGRELPILIWEHCQCRALGTAIHFHSTIVHHGAPDIK